MKCILDILKAFVKVWSGHKGLLHKLDQNRIGGALLKILTDLLKLWKERVILNGHCSSWSDVLLTWASVLTYSVFHKHPFVTSFWFLFASIIYLIAFSVTKNVILRGCSNDIASSYFFRPSKGCSMLHHRSVGYEFRKK